MLTSNLDAHIDTTEISWNDTYSERYTLIYSILLQKVIFMSY